MSYTEPGEYSRGRPLYRVCLHVSARHTLRVVRPIQLGNMSSMSQLDGSNQGKAQQGANMQPRGAPPVSEQKRLRSPSAGTKVSKEG